MKSKKLAFAALIVLQIVSLQARASTNCLIVNKDEVAKTLTAISSPTLHPKFYLEVAVKNQFTARDTVACKVLKVGTECRGARIAYHESYHLRESIIWDLESEKCYRY